MRSEKQSDIAEISVDFRGSSWSRRTGARSAGSFRGYGKLSTVPVDKQGDAALTAAWHRHAIGVPKKEAAPAGAGNRCLHPDRAVPK
ncbi:hypothetical protein CBM2592_B100278 [Cupriavidus taiwanensis]|nr:hypothetical protein CBM2592_B100278 [Cupriavidus taiwanensis]SOY98065.1 hypothetical protein CBM2591_B80280 [Cupriavidus taiwanensis]SOZ31779.1 hypothetical protein CBM2608_B90132 [Cupriavidus taiwanensis]SOZ84986.1 hypothetical protein CBM2618_B120089 [Cupriavidus taiwanensis]SOZ88213.1 hypothetical protein CBM2622_B130088 [Cupriavidus taiwanensis]